MSRNIKQISYVVITIIICGTLSSGCLNVNNGWPITGKFVNSIFAEGSLIYREVENINYTNAESEIEKLGYNVSTHLSPTPSAPIPPNKYFLDAQKRNVLDNPHNGDITIFIQGGYDNTTSATISVSYWPNSLKGYSSSNQTAIQTDKQYIADKVKEIVNICNITFNVNDLVWTISSS